MWQEAKANDKRIRELMVDHKKRAERRRAYYESRLGDPLQLIRVIGSASKLYPDAEQFYYHENTDNFMPWQANPDIKIDRFDGRSLLDYVPTTSKHYDNKEDDMTDELNFERYHDLIEAERLNVSEKERLAEVEEEWTKLLDRHQAKLNMIRQQEKSSHRSGHYGFDYGTRKVTTEETDTSQLLKQEDILQHVDDLTDQDKQVLNAMSSKYGIRSYARLLRVAKKDRDDELRSLKRKQQEGKPKSEKSEQRKRRRRKRRRHRGDSDEDDFGRMDRSGRHSPSYEPYHQGSDSNSSSSSSDYTDDEDHQKTSQSHDVSDDVVIEFGSSVPEEQTQESDPSHIHSPSTASTLTAVATETTEKKLTPMEKLKLKMRQGLQKQIVSDEKDRRKKENEKEIEHLQALARNQGLPIHTYLRPEPPRRKQAESSQERYRSPSSSDNENQQTKEQSNTRYRSPSPDKDRKRYRSPSEDRDRRRYRSPSSDRDRKRYRSPSSSSDNRRRRHRSSSRRHSSSRRRSTSRHRSSSRHRSKRYRSPSSSPDRSHKSRHHHKSSHRHHRHSYSHKK